MMELRTYDEVDASEVLSLNLYALGFPLTFRLAAALREHDRRYLPYLAFYAVEAGKVAGQAGLLTTLVETTAGPMKFGAAWAVCTLPQFGRQGIARALMQKVEQTAAELGCQAITLGTSRARVAHRLYRSLNYEDFIPTYAAFHAGPPLGHRSEPLVIQRLPETAWPEAERTFAKNTEGMLGFVHRQEGFLKVAARTAFDANEFHGVYSDGMLSGYVLARLNGEGLYVRCAVLPPGVALHQVVERLRDLYPSAYVVVESLTSGDQAESLRQAGYSVAETWGTIMLKPLTPGHDFRALLGQPEGRFYMDVWDIT